MPPNSREGPRLPGTTHACDALAAGEAVVVPNPPPMTYGLVATTAETINAVKGRALGQNVAVSMHDPAEWRRLLDCLDLPPAGLDGAGALLDRHLSVLLPLRPEAAPPDWVAPAVRAGQLSAFCGRWSPTAAVWERFPRLYGSSANRSGEPPATSAAAARAAFGHGCAVIDGDALADPSRRQAASTVLRLDRHGRVSLHRSGAHDQSAASRCGDYLDRVADVVGLPVDEHPGCPR